MSNLVIIPSPRQTAKFKRSGAYADLLWQRYPRSERWPGVLDLYEAAAYKRVCYNTLWRACIPGRDGKSRLRHQRFGAAYRIARVDLDRFGLVEGRAA